MNYKTDPPRLRDLPDETPDALASAIDELGGAGPTAQEFSALRTNVRLALGLPQAGGPSQPPAAPTTPGSIGAPAAAIKGTLTASQWVSWIVAPLGAGAIAGAILLGTTRSPEPTAVLPITAPSVVVPPTPRQDSTAFPVAPTVPKAPSSAASSAKDESTPIVNRAPRAEPPRAPAAPPQEVSPRIELAPAPDPAGYPQTTPPVETETEVSLLSRAQETLARDPARTLDLVRDHERRFDTGLLVQEREVIAIEALVRLGRKKEAETRAAGFHARFPRSAHGRRLDVLLQSGPN